MAERKKQQESERFVLPNRLSNSLIKETSLTAAKALHYLWHPTGKTFWRSTEDRKHEQEQLADKENKGTQAAEFYPTVSFTCSEALIELSIRHPEWQQGSFKDKLFEEYLPSILNQDVMSLDSSFDSDESFVPGLNPFSLARYIVCLGKAVSYNFLSANEIKNGIEKIKLALGTLNKQLSMTEKADPLAKTHPFILYHFSRALITARAVLDREIARLEVVGQNVIRQKKSRKTSETKNKVLSESDTYLLEARTLIVEIDRISARLLAILQQTLDQLLSRHVLKRLASSDYIALSYVVAALCILEEEGNTRYLYPALDICFEAQDPAGSWPLGRVVWLDPDRARVRLEIPTYEIAWALTEAVIAIVNDNSKEIASTPCKALLERITLSTQYTIRSVIELPDGSQEPRKGWCYDYPFDGPVIDSWSTASALFATLAAERIFDEERRAAILSTFLTTHPADQDWPGWLRWEKYVENGEVDEKHPILMYVNDKIVQPILRSPLRIPSERDETVSALLFGPPGTSKTTIAKGVADALDWPVVLLSPGDFIMQGLEYVEAQSRSVFSRLQALERAVVIFDECDELFRERKPEASREQMRSITAFITASMLPKLQDLHDRGRLVFFICTNLFNSLDSAIKRPGRIDHIIGVGPPDTKARLKIIEHEFSLEEREEVPYLNDAIKDLADKTELLTRGEIVRACRILRKQAWENKSGALLSVRNIAERLQKSRTIKKELYEIFEKDVEEFSMPHLRD